MNDKLDYYRDVYTFGDIKIGRALFEGDGRITITLEAIPVNGQMVMKPHEELEETTSSVSRLVLAHRTKWICRGLVIENLEANTPHIHVKTWLRTIRAHCNEISSNDSTPLRLSNSLRKAFGTNPFEQLMTIEMSPSMAVVMNDWEREFKDGD